MSQTQKEENRMDEPNMMAEMISGPGGNPITTLGDPLIKVDLKHLDATARWPSVASLATLRVFSKQNSTSRLKTVSGVMDLWEQSYGTISMGYKGKARDEYGKFANLAAAGGGTLSTNDAEMQALLNEGSRTAEKSRHWWERGRNK